MSETVNNRQPEGRVIPPMKLQDLEHYSGLSGDRLAQAMKTNEECEALARDVFDRNRDVQQAYGSPDKLLPEILEIRKTFESKSGFFNRAGNFFKKAGSWMWRNKLPIILTGLSVLGIRYAGDIKKWGGEKADQGFDYLADKLGLKKIKEQYDALHAKYDALKRGKQAPTDTPSAIKPEEGTSNLDDVSRGKKNEPTPKDTPKKQEDTPKPTEKGPPVVPKKEDVKPVEEDKPPF